MNLKRLTRVGILTAMSIVLIILIRFPLIPSATYLEYDAGDIPLLFISFAFGPLYALLATIVVAIIQGLTVSSSSGWVGIVMHIIATGALVVVSGSIYIKCRTIKGAIISLIAGTIAMVLVMIPANLFFTVRYWGVPYEAVVAMLPTAIIPFNLIKGAINSVIVFFIYKPLKNYLLSKDFF